jgi:hypothetical protein
MKDIVRVTPDFMTVTAHQEIVAEYHNSLDELAQLKSELRIIKDVWFAMTGEDLFVFFHNLQKVNEVGRELELGRAVSSAIGDQSTVVSNSTESEPDNGSTSQPDPTVDLPIIAFS